MTRPQWIALGAVVVMMAGHFDAAEPASVRAPLQPVRERTPAFDFALKDAAGKTVRLSKFRGRVVLLDFWATACGGCVLEIPSFIDIAHKYEKKGLATIGVSEDIIYEDLSGPDAAWSRVTPFVTSHGVHYTILMGDDHVTRPYHIESLPLTYLVDVHGRIAAVYSGAVDKGDIETNVQRLLAER